ncbi:carbohydrate ABC transporter permease [Micromonospora sp. NPDC003241]
MSADRTAVLARQAADPTPPTRPGTTGGPPRRPREDRGRRLFLVGMLAPMTVLLLAFTLYPFVSVLVGSLRRNDLTRPDEQGFAGLANFADALSEPGLLRAVLLTVGMVLVAVVAEFALGTLAASLLWRPLRGSRLYLALLVLPFGATPVAAYLSWRLMLNPDGGQINATLGALGLPTPGWTSEPMLAVVALVVVDIWQWAPFITLVMLAGLKSLPDETFEAGALDGANAVQRLVRIALPMLKPLVAFVVTIRAIDAIRTFDSIWIITGGGPGAATETLVVRIYRTAFNDLHIGEASALGLLLLVVLFILGKRFAAPALQRLEH